MAHLRLGERLGHAADSAYNGIWRIDNLEVPDGPAQSILVTPGNRTLDYICPGIVVLDGYQTASADFVAGERYEINCERDSGIEVVRSGA